MRLLLPVAKRQRNGRSWPGAPFSCPGSVKHPARGIAQPGNARSRCGAAVYRMPPDRQQWVDCGLSDHGGDCTPRPESRTTTMLARLPITAAAAPLLVNGYTRGHHHRMPEEMVGINPTSPHWPVLIVASWLLAASVQAAQPLFDTHLHYNVEDAAHYAPEAIVAQLKANGVLAATVTSRPPELALQLHAKAPRLILPVLGVYRTPADKATWVDDVGLPKRVEQALAEGPWQAVGELHLFAEDRRQPVFRQIVELSTSRGIPLRLHCDPAVIDTLFEQKPEATVIWAHAGAYPFPPLLRDYLQRYPGLYIDLSVRDQRVAPDGQLDPEWELLLLEHSDRFMVGVDTYRTNRWHAFPEVVSEIRNWLDQLPDEVSGAIAYRNAARLFQQNVDD